MQTAPLPCPVVATEDVYLILDDGRRLIDGMASWWTACHGYNHPHIRAEVAKQLERMPHVMFGGIHHPQALRLAERLAKRLPGDLQHVFFVDSGSVAVEVALKIAVQYWLNCGERGRSKFVCFRHAYHGDTTGAMSVCDPVNSMHAHFKGYLLEHYPREIPQTSIALSEFRSFLAEKRNELAGVIIEPLVQGAGGMKFHSPEALAGIRHACDEAGLLMIADEIATNFGRTGSMFACDQADIVPDIMCLGKALTGGTMSFAATVARNHVYEAFLSDNPTTALMHGPTYMANPLACAAANASLDLFETEPRLEQARAIERQLTEELSACRDVPEVVDVRCRGAIGVIEVTELHDVNALRADLVRRGVWLRPFGNMIYMTPPLTIRSEPLSELTRATVEAVRASSRRALVG
jgi:adenosylmethionine-8-amino-7-oxononanoate aminotransferase